jgi:hypothetical protein
MAPERARRRAALGAIGLLLAGALGLPAAPVRAAEADVLYSLVTEARWAQGLPGLVPNASLEAVAQAWAQQMAASDAISHNPSTGSQIPAGWTSWGENVAQGYASGAAMHEGWMGSTGHRANILGDFTDVGIAFIVAGGTTWGVEVFGTYPGHAGPAPPAPPAPAAPPEPPAPAEPAPVPSPEVATPSPTPTTAAPRTQKSPTPTPAPTHTVTARTGEPVDAVNPMPLILVAVLMAALAVGAAVFLRSRAGRHRGP